MSVFDGIVPGQLSNWFLTIKNVLDEIVWTKELKFHVRYAGA